MEVAQRLEGIQLTLQAHASDVKEQQEKLRQKLVILDADEHLREEYQMLLEQSYKQAAPYGGLSAMPMNVPSNPSTQGRFVVISRARSGASSGARGRASEQHAARAVVTIDRRAPNNDAGL